MTQPIDPTPTTMDSEPIPEPDGVAAPAPVVASPRSNLLALAFFVFVPFAGACLGVSSGATEQELRDDRAFPDVAASPFDEARWAEVGAWFEDRLPGRARAIELESDIARVVDNGQSSGTAISEQVSVGSDGWLFYNPSLQQPCITDEQERGLIAEIEDAARLLISTNRRLVVAIAPDRAAVVPERLAGLDVECLAHNREVVENLAARPDTIDLADSVSEEAHALRFDTHWAPAGALAAARQLVDTVQPGLWVDPDLAVTSIERTGDLQRFIQDEGFEVFDYPTFEAQSIAQVEEVSTSAPDYPMYRAETPGGDDLAVVLLHDSYGGYSDPVSGLAVGLAAEYIRPWFGHFTNVRLPGGGVVLAGESPIAETVVEADVVAMLFVQRTILDRLSTGQVVGPLVSALIDELDAQKVATDVTGDLQTTMPLPEAGVIVIDGPAAGTAHTLSVTATAGELLWRVDTNERVVVGIAEGSILSIGSEATEISFVRLP